jgi:hypothetical protein
MTCPRAYAPPRQLRRPQTGPAIDARGARADVRSTTCSACSLQQVDGHACSASTAELLSAPRTVRARRRGPAERVRRRGQPRPPRCSPDGRQRTARGSHWRSEDGASRAIPGLPGESRQFARLRKDRPQKRPFGKRAQVNQRTDEPSELARVARWRRVTRSSMSRDSGLHAARRMHGDHEGGRPTWIYRPSKAPCFDRLARGRRRRHGQLVAVPAQGQLRSGRGRRWGRARLLPDGHVRAPHERPIII